MTVKELKQQLDLIRDDGAQVMINTDGDMQPDYDQEINTVVVMGTGEVIISSN